MKTLLITNARLINEGEIRDADILVRGDRIEQVGAAIRAPERCDVIDAAGRGITSFMDMPNVNPLTTTRAALADKYERADGRCPANYGFYLGGTNTNIEEIKALEVGESCGIKVFMGASTGDMLVDDPQALDKIFEHAPVIVVTHCEDSPMIWANEARAKERYGEDVPMTEHPRIRSADACLKSSKLATNLASKHDALLHVLHLTTAIEMDLFSPAHRSEKRTTAEVFVKVTEDVSKLNARDTQKIDLIMQLADKRFDFDAIDSLLG